MIADQNFYDIFFMFFYPTASATAEGENCAYGPPLKEFNAYYVTELVTYLKEELP